MSGMSDLVEQTYKRLARRIQENLMADLGELYIAETQNMALLGIPSEPRARFEADLDQDAIGRLGLWEGGFKDHWLPFTRVVEGADFFSFRDLLDLPLRVDPRCE
jgi:hypothetical protein